MIKVKKKFVFLIYLYSFIAHLILIMAGLSCVHAINDRPGEAAADLSKNARAPFAFKVSLTGRRGNTYDESKTDVVAEFDKIKKLVGGKLPELLKALEPVKRLPEPEPYDFEAVEKSLEKFTAGFAEFKKAVEKSHSTAETALASNLKRPGPASINKKNITARRDGGKRARPKAAPGEVADGETGAVTARPVARGGQPGEAGGGPEVFGNLSGTEKSGARLAGTPGGELDPSIELKSIDLFKAIVGEKIRSKVKYPQNCRRLGIEGSVRVKFEVNSGGTVSAVEIAGSSGNRDIDAAAVAAVKEGEPFLPYPRDISRKSLSFVLPLNFKLND